MGIFQKYFKTAQYGIELKWLQGCSYELQQDLKKFNQLLQQASQKANDELYYSQVFEQFCIVLIHHKSELKLDKIIKLQLLKELARWMQVEQANTVQRSLKLLSEEFISNNIHEAYSAEEIQDLYFFSYLDTNDLVDTLAVQERFIYKHDPRLEISSEILDLAQQLKIILPAQKLSLFYTQHKKALLKHLIQPEYKFNNIYQDINFLIKYLINSYITHLTETKLDQI